MKTEEELNEWFEKLTPLRKLVVMTYLADSCAPITKYIKMGMKGLLKDNFCGYLSYEEAIGEWSTELYEDKVWVYEEYKKATEK